MSKDFNEWLSGVRANIPHFGERDLMCDVPWAHLARLVKEHDDWKEEATRLTEAAITQGLDKIRNRSLNESLDGKEDDEGNLSPSARPTLDSRDRLESEGAVSATSYSSEAWPPSEPCFRQTFFVKEGDIIRLNGKEYIVEVSKP
jgi:hypothetical protein